MEIFLHMDISLLYDEKICQSSAQAILPSLLGNPKLSSKQMDSPHIFRRMICRKSARLVQIKFVFPRDIEI
jgi:hypothetical protein